VVAAREVFRPVHVMYLVATDLRLGHRGQRGSATCVVGVDYGVAGTMARCQKTSTLLGWSHLGLGGQMLARAAASEAKCGADGVRICGLRCVSLATTVVRDTFRCGTG
jgi:hypothetical protein